MHMWKNYHTCSGIFNEPVNAGMDKKMAFMTSISVFPKKYSRLFAIELARQLL